MQKVTLENSVSVQIKKSTRAKRVRILVSCEGVVTAVQPVRTPLERVLWFLETKRAWIEAKLHFFNTRPPIAAPQKIQHSKKEYAVLRRRAKALVTERLEYFNQFYQFSYNKVFIKNQKSRWGSCSSRGNLNFSYKIIFLPPEAQDYLIVHELCHLKELNHSTRFWNLVAEQIPEYKAIHKTLRYKTIA